MRQEVYPYWLSRPLIGRSETGLASEWLTDNITCLGMSPARLEAPVSQHWVINGLSESDDL